jgi:hypothetical protein
MFQVFGLSLSSVTLPVLFGLERLKKCGFFLNIRNSSNSLNAIGLKDLNRINTKMNEKMINLLLGW